MKVSRNKKRAPTRGKMRKPPISAVAELGVQLNDIARKMKCSVSELLDNAETSDTFKEEYVSALHIAGTLRALGYK